MQSGVWVSELDLWHGFCCIEFQPVLLMWKKPKRCRFKHRTPLDDVICSILLEFDRIAVVGLSDDPWRDSNYVASWFNKTNE
jgi:hypothetical protein